jgi:hypothetical protein
VRDRPLGSALDRFDIVLDVREVRGLSQFTSHPPSRYPFRSFHCTSIGFRLILPRTSTPDDPTETVPTLRSFLRT